MTVPLDIITHKRLLLIKQIYQRAVVQSASQHSDVDRILCLISFDLAIETLLKNSILAVDSKAKIVSDLGELITTANSVFTKAVPSIPLVPDTQKIRQVRKIRNAAMHDAIYPTATDISDCRTYTRDFLQQLVLNVWGVSFDTIKLTDLIRNNEIKKYLSQAEIELEKGEYTEAAFQSMAGFNFTLERIKSTVVGTTAFASEIDNGIFVALHSIKNVLILPVIGLDYSNYNRYKHLTKYLMIANMGDGKIMKNIAGPQPTADDAVFIVNYAVNSVIQIESFVGDIDKPFGYDFPSW